MSDELSDLYLQVPCSRCLSQEGQSCTTRNGLPCRTHMARCNPINSAFGLGYVAAEADQRVINERRARR